MRGSIMDTQRSTSVSKEVAGKNLIDYRGYIGKVEYDDEAGIFHGVVVNLKDVITFRGASVAELRQDLKESVEEYLAFCKELGRDPEEPGKLYSGKFIVRVGPDLHRALAVQARDEQVSLNQWVKKMLERAIM